ncbi:HEPN domain-containing protein [Luteimonas sp. 22616]|uniref:HEPN domain-containing protein n=1 Tax=Luteimonas sp. 22616 TaxID=3453951 RepID=UPI003F84242E
MSFFPRLRTGLLRLPNMQRAIDSFRKSLLHVEHLGGLHAALAGLTTSAVDGSDLLRAQIVLSVSALDYYVHEVTVLGMKEIFESRRPPTTAFLKYRVSVAVASSGSAAVFEAEVRERHSFLSFQQPEKVADAVRLFSEIDLWKAVASAMSTTDRAVKDQLKLLIDRRNKIAHEADLIPGVFGERWPIETADVTRSLSFVRNICEGIHTSIV